MELWAEFTGNKPEKFSQQKRFCGLRSESSLSNNSGWPLVACWEVQKTLSSQLSIAKSKPIKVESDESVREEVQSEQSLDKIKQIITDHKSLKKKKDERDEILLRFRNLAYNNFYIHPGEEVGKNAHISSVAKPEDLSTKEVLKRVDVFLKLLTKITGSEYNPKAGLISLAEFTRPARNCKQCPSHDRNAFAYEYPFHIPLG